MSNPTTPAPMLPPESEQPSEAQAAARGMGQIASIGKETVEASAWLLNIPAPPERAVKPRAEISLGDLAQAVTVLQPADPMLHTEIAALLGLRPREAALQILIEQEPTREETVTGEQTVIRDRADPEVIPASRRKSRRPRPALSARPVRFTVQLEEEREPESIPSWLATYDHKQRDAAPNLPPVPLPELIPANYIRALLARLLAAPIPEGLVDVEELVETIAHGRPVSYIPRQPIPSLRLGVQLLIDTSESMAPFSEDQDYLLEHIQDLVGSDNLELLWFEKNPLQGVYGENDDDPRAYEPPPHGSKVLLLSDLGLGDRTPQASSSGLWRRFARIIHEADAYLLALVPYGSWRWPSTLSGILPMLYWERFWNPRRPWRRTALPASKALRTLARRNPQALELAKFLSLAARIDRPLLRAARLQLLPKMDAGAEADIWLSPLAQSRSFASMLLSPKVARELRRLLAEDGKEAVEEAWQFLSAFRERGGINYDVRQEEYMNYLALHPDFDEVTEATKLLQEALAALVKGGEQRLDVARWALRAVPRLPDTVRNLPVAGELYYASAVRLGTTPADESVLPEDMDRLEWLQPADASTISVGAQLIQGGLKFSREVAPDMAELRVKDTTPVLLDVSWPAVVTAEKQQVTIGPTGPVTLGAASCQLISVSDDGTIGHWQVQNGEEIAVFGEPEQYLQCQAVSPDGRLLAGGDREGTFALWDLLTGRQLFRQERESPDIGTDNIDISQQFTKNANIGSSDIGPDEIQDQGIIALAFSSDGRYLAAARAGRSVEIWRIYGTRPRLNLTLSNPATALAFDPRNHNLVTGDQDGRVIYWDLSSHEIETEPVAGIDLMVEAADAERLGFSVERRGAIHAVAFVADEQQIVTGDQNGLILLWRVDPPTLWSGFNGLKGAVSGFAFDSGSGQVAVGSQDTLAILRIENNQILQRERREFPALSAAFSPDGHFLFTGLRSGEIRVLESEGLEEISKISGHHLTVSGLSAFNSPAATYTINTSEGRQYTIGPDRRALSFSPLLTFDHLIDGSRRALHSEVFVALDEIDAWLASAANDPQQPHRAFVASSGPGGGKSTLSGTLVEISRGQADDAATYQNLRENLLAAVHICSSDQEKSLDARTFVMSLAQQIAGYMPEFGERLHAAGQLSGAAAAWAANPANGDQLEFNITPLAAEDQPAAALLQTYLVEPLAQLPGRQVSGDLVNIVAKEKLDPAVYKRAGEMLVGLRAKHLPVTWLRAGRGMRCHPRFREYLLERLH
ncbi:MAG: hypothetical protein R3293_21975, partial [Candidatus Promineifilaceae bacterium]|nr:hypothetical protein [Candidatus Promineifilaceae bacterium]